MSRAATLQLPRHSGEGLAVSAAKLQDPGTRGQVGQVANTAPPQPTAAGVVTIPGLYGHVHLADHPKKQII